VNGTPVRTTIEDGIKALELAELATRSWREGEGHWSARSDRASSFGTNT
jgi:myo-inositol 2-dehydrogenase/D-chiro-inositol 1-dehydrogenase